MTTPKDKDRIPEFLKTDNLKSFFKNLNEKIPSSDKDRYEKQNNTFYDRFRTGGSAWWHEPFFSTLRKSISFATGGRVEPLNIPVDKISRDVTGGKDLKTLEELNDDIQINTEVFQNTLENYGRPIDLFPSIFSQYDIAHELNEKIIVDPDNLDEVNRQRARLANHGYVLKNSRNQTVLRDTLPDWDENSGHDPNEKVHTGLKEEFWVRPQIRSYPETVTINSAVLAQELKDAEQTPGEHGIKGAAAQMGGDLAFLGATYRLAPTSTIQGINTNIVSSRAPKIATQVAANVTYMKELYDEHDVIESMTQPRDSFEEVLNAAEFGVLPVVPPILHTAGHTLRGITRSLRPLGGNSAESILYKKMVEQGIDLLEVNPTIEKAIITEEAITIRTGFIEHFNASEEEADLALKWAANLSLQNHGDANYLFRKMDVFGISQERADFHYASAFEPDGYLFQTSSNPVEQTVDAFALEFNTTTLLNATEDQRLINSLGQTGYRGKDKTFTIGGVGQANTLLNYLENPRTIVFKSGQNQIEAPLRIPKEEIAHLGIKEYIKSYALNNNTNVIPKSVLDDYMKQNAGLRKINIGYDQYNESAFYGNNGGTISLSINGDTIRKPKVLLFQSELTNVSDSNPLKQQLLSRGINRKITEIDADGKPIREIDSSPYFASYNDHYYRNFDLDSRFETKNVTAELRNANVNNDRHNIHAHVRHVGLVDIEGNTLFHIEEAQSDLEKVISGRFLKDDFVTKNYILDHFSIVDADSGGYANRIQAAEPSIYFENKMGNGLTINASRDKILISPANKVAIQNTNSENIGGEADSLEQIYQNIINLYPSVNIAETLAPEQGVVKSITLNISGDSPEGIRALENFNLKRQGKEKIGTNKFEGRPKVGTLTMSIVKKVDGSQDIPILTLDFHSHDHVMLNMNLNQLKQWEGIGRDLRTLPSKASRTSYFRVFNHEIIETITQDLVKVKNKGYAGDIETGSFTFTDKQILNGETGFVIRRESDGSYSIYDLSFVGGEEYPSSLGQTITSKVNSNLSSEKEAIQSIRNIINPNMINQVPPELGFPTEWRFPILRAVLNEAANDGQKKFVTWSNPKIIEERYAGANTEFKNSRYGSTLTGQKRDGEIVSGLKDILLNLFQQNYNPNTTRADIESLFTTKIINTTWDKEPNLKKRIKDFMDQDVEPNALFDPVMINPTKRQEASDQLEHFSFDVIFPSGYDNAIETSLKKSSAIELEDIIKNQQSKKTLESLKSSSKLEADVITVLKQLDKIGRVFYSETNEAYMSMLMNTWSSQVTEYYPKVIREMDLVGSEADDTASLSVHTLLRLLNVSNFNVDSSANDIVNVIADLALKNAQNQKLIDSSVIHNNINTGNLIELKSVQAFQKTIGAFHFGEYSLHNGNGQLSDFAKSIGWKTLPSSKASARNAQEAVKYGTQRMFQLKGQTPQGGKVLGLTDFTNTGHYLLRATNAANFMTLVHELSHVFRRNLTEEQLRVAGEFAYGKQAFNALDNKMLWNRKAEEKFAEAFETYVKTGFAETEVKGIFESLKTWMINIYRSIKGTPLEEKLDPKIKELFDQMTAPYTPSNEKIMRNLPPELHGVARTFYGIRENNVRAFDSGNGDVTGRLFQTGEEVTDEQILEEMVRRYHPVPNLSPLTSIEETINVNLQDPSKWVLLPIIKQVIGAFDPAAVANDPLRKALIAKVMLEEEGKQLAEIAFSQLSQLGIQAKVFGDLDDAGRLQGDLKGFNLNDIRANPSDSRWKTKLTLSQTQWIDTANELEEAKLAMFKSEGIDINTLDVEEGGFYAGRRVLGKVLADGEIVDIAVVGGPSRPGMKTAQEKKRIFETAEEAIEAGYRYLDDDETLQLNLVGAYRRAAQKRFVDYVLANVVYTRSSEVVGDVVAQRELTRKRFETVEVLIDELQRAKRGGSMSAQTKIMLETWLPEVEGMLDDVSKISLQQLVKAGQTAADQPIRFVPRKGVIKSLFRRVKQLETEIEILKENGQEVPVETTNQLNIMKSKLGFQKFAISQAYENFKETGNFEYTFERSATSIFMEDKKGAIDELLTAFRGEAYTDSSGATRYRGGFKEFLRNEKFQADKEYLEAKEKLSKASSLEGDLSGKIPAFAGKIFTQNQPTNLGTRINPNTGNPIPITGADVEDIIGKSIIDDQEFYGFLNTVNTVNSASRFFMLAGDASLFAIQLFFLAGQAIRQPTFMPKVMTGFIRGFIDPEAHARMINNNRELLEKNRGVLLSIQGTEFTDFARQMSRAGFIRSKPIRLVRDTVGQVPGAAELGRGYLGFFRGSQRAFELAIDTAGVELLKAFDHAGTNKYDDPVARQQLADFINEFRGLANPRRLGVSTKQRQLETFALLAPRYNRAIAALITDLGRDSMRGQLARQTMGSALAFTSAMAVGISIALGEDEAEIARHFDPRSSQFMTWNVDGQQIGIGTKVRSLVKLAASIYVTAEGDEPVDLFTLSMDNPVVRFARGNAAPVLGDTISILSGRTYLGDPVFGSSPFALADHVKNLSSEILLPKMMPIWAQSVVLEGGNPRQRVTRGLIEFFGGRAYPEGSWQIMNNFAQDIIGLPYEELEPFERKLLRELNEDELLPIMQERLYRGDKDAQYWLQLDQLDKDRYQAEIKLLNGFFNPAQNPEFRKNGRYVLQQQFNQIQNNYSLQRDDLNKTFGKFQDDAEYDPDDEAKFVLNQWYKLYEQAENPNTGVFDYKRLELLQANFWTRKTPEGLLYNNFRGYITRNTSNTKHPEPYKNLLSRTTTNRWIIAEQARRDFLKNRGNWASLLDNR